MPPWPTFALWAILFQVLRPLPFRVLVDRFVADVHTLVVGVFQSESAREHVRFESRLQARLDGAKEVTAWGEFGERGRDTLTALPGAFLGCLLRILGVVHVAAREDRDGVAVDPFRSSRALGYPHPVAFDLVAEGTF